ncbi:hypothetical protein ACFL6C_08815 [Myxococcota bacterium]
MTYSAHRALLFVGRYQVHWGITVSVLAFLACSCGSENAVALRLVADLEGRRYASVSGDTIVAGGCEYGGWLGRFSEKHDVVIFRRDDGGKNKWGEVQELTLLDSVFGEVFAVDGDTIAVGGVSADINDRYVGSIHVYDRNGDTWTHVATILLPDDIESAQGPRPRQISLSNDTVWVTTHHSVWAEHDEFSVVRVFERDAGGPDNWGQVATFEGLGFVYQVAFSGDTAVVTHRALGCPGLCAVYGIVLERNHGGDNNWGEVSRIPMPEGASTALDGNIMVIGGPIGRAGYVFQRIPKDGWHLIKQLVHREDDWGFGHSVSVSGKTVAVSASVLGPGDQPVGAVYIYKRHLGGRNNWRQAARIDANEDGVPKHLGWRVSLSGDTLAVSDVSENPDSTAVYHLAP